VPEQKRENMHLAVKQIWHKGIFKSLWLEMKSWGAGMRYIALVNFFIGFVAVISDLVVPIKVFQETGSYVQIVILGIVIALPSLFDINLGKFADGNRTKALWIGMLSLCILLIILTFTSNFIVQIVIAFLLTMNYNLINLASDGLATMMVKRTHYGRMGGLNGDIDTMGSIVGAFVIGILMDVVGFSNTVAILAGMSLIILWIISSGRSSLENVLVKVKGNYE
jgi:predicted MFS family arabinose efflux permease